MNRLLYYAVQKVLYLWKEGCHFPRKPKIAIPACLSTLQGPANSLVIALHKGGQWDTNKTGKKEGEARTSFTLLACWEGSDVQGRQNLQK